MKKENRGKNKGKDLVVSTVKLLDSITQIHIPKGLNLSDYAIPLINVLP